MNKRGYKSHTNVEGHERRFMRNTFNELRNHPDYV